MYGILRREIDTGYETMTKSLFNEIGYAKQSVNRLNTNQGPKFGYEFFVVVVDHTLDYVSHD